MPCSPTPQGVLCPKTAPPPPQGTSMKLSISPLNSLWLYVERGLGFRIFCGFGGRVGGLGNDEQSKHENLILRNNPNQSS